jgi:hypothetical protein
MDLVKPSSRKPSLVLACGALLGLLALPLFLGSFDLSSGVVRVFLMFLVGFAMGYSAYAALRMMHAAD